MSHGSQASMMMAAGLAVLVAAFTGSGMLTALVFGAAMLYGQMTVLIAYELHGRYVLTIKRENADDSSKPDPH